MLAQSRRTIARPSPKPRSRWHLCRAQGSHIRRVLLLPPPSPGPRQIGDRGSLRTRKAADDVAARAIVRRRHQQRGGEAQRLEGLPKIMTCGREEVCPLARRPQTAGFWWQSSCWLGLFLALQGQHVLTGEESDGTRGTAKSAHARSRDNQNQTT